MGFPRTSWNEPARADECDVVIQLGSMTLRARRRATRDGHIRKHTGPAKTCADGTDRFEVCTLVEPRAKSGNQLISKGHAADF